ncbi:coagulation factor V [Toxotes jaculatrix]|uniref:coagulation factor V n=1 Tax=Toxotes jaculatrix TaxID=941984 RepID=UPI001B3B043C|nr:coagulation factor V [Toxotes jaculatrix]
MRLCPWAGSRCLLPVLVVLTVVLYVQSDQHQPRERHYYIAAVEIDWKYHDNDTHRFGPTYKKVVFREYEKDFRQAKTHPSWLGLLGPTLRAEEGETIVVTFRNMATEAHSIHPHGVAYGKQSEGANYFDNTSQKEKEDDVVQPNSEHVYHWEVTSDVSPQPNDPTCLTYTYISHQNVVEDYNLGLIGTLLICKPGSLDESGKQIGVHQEYVFLFGVFDEKESKNKPNGYDSDNHVKYTINGYTKGSLPDVSVCAHSSVSLHLLGMSSEPEVFSVHMNGQVLQQTGHKVSSVGLISGSTATVSMVALHEGRWLLSSHTLKHIEAGMHGFVDVKKCDGFKAPLRQMTIEQRRQSREWTYYIAAEEIMWDYAPTMHEHVDEDFKHQYLRQSSTRIGRKYKKAVYTLYKNESFTERLETKQRKNELGILGPVIRAQIRDVIKIVFKNKASRPYSIYPHGLTIAKSEEGVNYPEGGNHSHGVQPGETYTYVWRVVEEDEPLEGDSRCLTRMYHSAVDAPRDIASGLIGPILICKSQSLNVRNVQLKADKEQHAIFAVFDENKSWYLDYNVGHFCDRTKVSKTDPDFYKSNVMHTINGYAFESGPLLGFCNGEVATWHVSSIGAQDYIQTATFYGHAFELNERTEDFLSLYPMTGETITMSMDNIGVWLLASLNSHETTKGMRVKFQDVECYRDYQYEYNDYEDATVNKEFTVWKPPSWDDIKKEEEKPKPVKEKPVEVDVYTDMFAEELGLRSLKNQSMDSEAEELDLSFLDYDAIDVLDGGPNVTLNFTAIKSNNKTSIPKPNAQNETSFPNWKEVDGVNFTEVSLLNHSISENTKHTQNRSAAPIFDKMKTENTTVFNNTNDLPKNDSITTNSSSSPVVSNPKNDSVSDTKNTTIHNATALSAAGNVSTDTHTNLTATLQGTANLTVTLPGNLSSLLEPEQTNVNLTASVSPDSAEDSEERLTRGDVFSYSAPVSNSSSLHSTPEGNVSATTLPPRDDVNNTATNYVNVSADATNHSVSVPASDVGEVNINSTDRSNSTTLDLENTDNTTSDNGSLSAAAKPEYGLQMNSSEVEPNRVNSSLENVTHTLLETGLLQNGSVNSKYSDISRSNGSKSTGELSSDSRENITALFGELNHTSSSESFSNETVGSGNLSFSSDAVKNGGSEELSASESSEEVLIYLKGNNTEVIKTTSVKTQDYNWPYEGTHQMVPMEIPDHMMKYFEKETPQTTPAPKKKIKRVTLRHRPQKGEGMKTKRRKVYKPVARSGLPMSPRGFNPGMTPRGSRPSAPQPFSDEEDLINMPVVIGVPRPDFSDYELYIPGDEPDRLGFDEQDVKEDEYEYVTYKDPYSSHEDIKNLNLDETTKYYLKFSGPNVKTYFIAAEEVEWDYGGYGQRRQDKSQLNSRETTFTKVVFRRYMDSSFSTPDIRGEIDEHLGILGPLIKAEVGQSIMVVFRNNAHRPYSIHPNGVSYTKQTEGLSYEDGSKYWYKYDNEVQPNTTFTYLWKVSSMVGPTAEESHCRTWAYYSGVNPERDIHSGLIGPLLVCREGTLDLPDIREFVLLFMTFDESQSWYYEKNREIMQRKSRRRIMDPNLKDNLKFHSINGIIYNLKGLRMYTNQLVCWHLINVGSPKDFQSVHFHGQTFLHKKTTSYRQAVYPLLPGNFATLEMYPSKPGLWQLETEVGLNQHRGMQTLFLVLDNDCYRPLGLQSGSVKDNQITALNTRGYWEPHLARLNNQGKYNAWSTEQNNSWIQVDFQRPVVVSQVATQGAKQMFHSQYVVKYLISYSYDRRKWIFYKGDSKGLRKVFQGNQEAYETKKNTFFPPVIGRFIRLHPINWYNKATLRMEFYGCELDGCSVPLGIESGLIEDRRITASSTASSWYSGPWKPSLARLNRQGTINAWQAKYNDMNQWLQVELPQVKKITGIITQGAKSLGTEMYVMSYTLQHSDNGIHWNQYTDDEDLSSKTFSGNKDNNDHVKNYIYPPIFSRFIRIVPRSWMNSITMRIELLGCDFE